MAGSLKNFIEKKLKENIPLSDIRKDLKEKGYDIQAVNNAVRDAISGLNKKAPPLPSIQIIVLVIGVIIAVGVGIYINLNVERNLCDGSEKISCEQAGKVALEAYPGKLSKIEKKEVIVPSSSFEGASELIDAWVVSVATENTNIELQIDPETFKILSVGLA